MPKGRNLNILFVTPYVPSPVRIRPFAFIRELAKRGHRVTLACLVQPSWEDRYLPAVTKYCQGVYPVPLKRLEPFRNTLFSIPTRTPLSVAYCRSSEFSRTVRDLVRDHRFDLIHTEFVRAAPATAGLNGPTKVFDAVDSLALAYRRSLVSPYVTAKQRLISLIEWPKMRHFESNILRYFHRALVSSPVDRLFLAGEGDAVTVMPNGVDLDYFNSRREEGKAETIVFLGKLSYYVNVASVLWFYHNVFPIIRSERPGVRFRIVGRNPVPQISALAADPAVEVTGTVPDVRPFLAQAALAICPMVAGSGIQNKLLEAMAMGVPCVATRLACQALNVREGSDLMVADTPEGFASAVCDLLEDAARRQQLGERGRRYVEIHHDWNQIGEKLVRIYGEVLDRDQEVPERESFLETVLN